MRICRTDIARLDRDVLGDILCRTPCDKLALCGLLDCPDTLDQILDTPALTEGILEGLDHGQTSMELRIYLSTRRRLSQAGLQGRDVADYLASLLAYNLQDTRPSAFVFASPITTVGALTLPIQEAYHAGDMRTALGLHLKAVHMILFLMIALPERLHDANPVESGIAENLPPASKLFEMLLATHLERASLLVNDEHLKGVLNTIHTHLGRILSSLGNVLSDPLCTPPVPLR